MAVLHYSLFKSCMNKTFPFCYYNSAPSETHNTPAGQMAAKERCTEGQRDDARGLEEL